MSDGVQRELGAITEQIKSLHNSLTILTIEQNKKLDGIGGKLDYTNGKVRNHDFWIKAVKWGAGIVCGFALLITPYIVEYLSTKIAEDVQRKIEIDLEKKIGKVLSTYEFEEQ